MAESGKVGYCHEEGERLGIQVTSYVQVNCAILLSDVHQSAVLKAQKIDVYSCRVAIQWYHTNSATVISTVYTW